MAAVSRWALAGASESAAGSFGTASSTFTGGGEISGAEPIAGLAAAGFGERAGPVGRSGAVAPDEEDHACDGGPERAGAEVMADGCGTGMSVSSGGRSSSSDGWARPSAVPRQEPIQRQPGSTGSTS